MADRNKDLLGRLADLSEEAVQRLADAPGADRALQALKALGDKVDELQRRTRGFEELESRLSALEKKFDSLSKAPARASSRRTSPPPAPPKSGPPRPAGVQMPNMHDAGAASVVVTPICQSVFVDCA